MSASKLPHSPLRVAIIATTQPAAAALGAAAARALAAQGHVLVTRGQPGPEAAALAAYRAAAPALPAEVQSANAAGLSGLIILDGCVELCALSGDANLRGLPRLDLEQNGLFTPETALPTIEAFLRALAAAPSPLLPDRVGPDLPDQLGILPEVRRFAHLALDRAVRPPMAIALLGSWGAGKSFYLDRLAAEIDRLAAAPDATGRRLRKVCVIRFNAWHFVDTNLWASLATHIFTELDHWARKARAVPLHLQRANQEQKAAQAALILRQAELRLVEQQDRLRRAEEAAAQAAADDRARLRTAGAVADPDVVAALGARRSTTTIDALKKSLQALGLPAQDAAALSQGDWFRSLQQLTHQPAAVFSAMGHTLLAYDPFKFLLILLLVLITVLPMFVDSLQGLDASALQAFVAAGAVFKQVHYAYQRVQEVALQAQALDAEATAIREEVLAKRDADRARALETDQRALAALSADREAAQAQLRQQQEALEALRPEARLQRLSAQGAEASGPYRKEEGLIAALRRDLSSLEQIIREDPDNLDRVILTIDDLDRCPPEAVAAVLQAIHLLLAYELFVVVIAADPRWLRAAASRMTSTDESVDWLEKVFQIPYWVERLRPAGFTSIVNSLLAPGAHRPDEEAATLPGEDLSTAFTVSPTEHAFACRLHPFVSTPRAARRFVNTYRLLRAAVPPTARAPFLATDHRLTLTLLALAVGAPDGSGPLLGQFAAGADPDTVFAKVTSPSLGAALVSLRPELPPSGPAWAAEAARVARFTFAGLGD